MVATTGPDCQQFPAVLKINSAKIELVDTAELEVMTKTCLERWARAQNKVPPNKIIIYRDGVSEGMYKSVVEKEYLTIRDIANKFCANLKHDPPKITVIICGKRHHVSYLGLRHLFTSSVMLIPPTDSLLPSDQRICFHGSIQQPQGWHLRRSLRDGRQRLGKYCRMRKACISGGAPYHADALPTGLLSPVTSSHPRHRETMS